MVNPCGRSTVRAVRKGNEIMQTQGPLLATTGERQLRPLGARKVLFFGKNMSRSRATGGLVEALRSHGLQVRWVNYATLRRWLGEERAQRRIRRIFAAERPDLVFVFCRDLPRVLLAEFSGDAQSVCWVDAPMTEMPAAYMDYLSLAQHVFLTNPNRVPDLTAAGHSSAHFVLEGFSASNHYALPARSARRDLLFIGGPGLDGERGRFLDGIGRHFDLEVRGRKWEPYRRDFPNLRIGGPVRPASYRRLCASSKIVLGLNQLNDEPLYFSNRTFLTLACGAFHLTHYIPGLERVFGDGQHLAWFRSQDECLERIGHFLANGEERQRIAQAGHELVHRDHRFANRVGEVLAVLRGAAIADVGNPGAPQPVAVGGK